MNNTKSNFFSNLWNRFKKFFVSDGNKTILSSIASIIIGLVIGLFIMILITFINKENSIGDAFRGIRILMSGPFSSRITRYLVSNTGDMIFYAVPLIMTGLSVALSYKSGLFNIGAAGQFIIGTMGCLIVSLSIHSPNRAVGILVWFLALLFGALLASIWGAIPGILKAFFNINEVISCIMTNWIAANLSSWVFKYIVSLHSTENTKGAYLIKNTINYTPKLGLDKLFPGSYIDGGLIVAVMMAIMIFIILNKTRLGFELKACGSNREAARYAGLNAKRNIVLSMSISGALAGIGAALYYLNPGIEYNYVSQYSILPAYGFNGIASAFLANCNPIGIIFTSLFIRYINMGGEYLTKVGFNRYVADIVISIIIYNAAFTTILKELITRLMYLKENKKNHPKDEEIKDEVEQKNNEVEEVVHE